MAQAGFRFDSEKVLCSICLHPMEYPLTIPCGHSYCKSCIENHWNVEEASDSYSCPQCRQTFSPRPVLGKNTMLAELLDELKMAEYQPVLAGPEDVACDSCTDRKLRAVQSCLQCLVSFCQQHLQPHYESPAFEKHKLVNPSKNLKENICSQHGEVKKIFCRTDQRCICSLCFLDEHKSHETVSAETERREREKQLGPSRQKIQQKLQEREKEMKVLQKEVEAIDCSADEAVVDSEKISAELILLVQKKHFSLNKLIRDQQKKEVNRVKQLIQNLEQEISELSSKDADLDRLSQTKNPAEFLHMCPLLSELSRTSEPACPEPRHLQHFSGVTAAAAAVKEKLEKVLSNNWPKVSATVTRADVLLPQPEPQTRAEFLHHFQQVTLDPNTVNMQLVLSHGDRKSTYRSVKQAYPSHPERFTSRSQVLSREALMGRHYWEVEWTGSGAHVAVAYKNVPRTGENSEFGNNKKSWALLCSDSQCEFRHNSTRTPVSGLRSQRVGVYLDHRAGVLSFYSIAETMSLLHRVQTTFSQPLRGVQSSSLPPLRVDGRVLCPGVEHSFCPKSGCGSVLERSGSHSNRVTLVLSEIRSFTLSCTWMLNVLQPRLLLQPQKGNRKRLGQKNPGSSTSQGKLALMTPPTSVWDHPQ